jgi:hypothetical protein
VINPKHLNPATSNPVRHDEWRLRDDKLARPRHPARPPEIGILRQQHLNTPNDVQGHPLRDCRIVRSDERAKRKQILNRLL